MDKITEILKEIFPSKEMADYLARCPFGDDIEGCLRCYEFDDASPEKLPLRRYDMNIKDLLGRIKQPCDKCPYKLGMVHTVVNPCPQCKLNGYKTYERFTKELAGRNVNDL